MFYGRKPDLLTANAKQGIEHTHHTSVDSRSEKNRRRQPIIQVLSKLVGTGMVRIVTAYMPPHARGAQQTSSPSSPFSALCFSRQYRQSVLVECILIRSKMSKNVVQEKYVQGYKAEMLIPAKLDSHNNKFRATVLAKEKAMIERSGPHRRDTRTGMPSTGRSTVSTPRPLSCIFASVVSLYRRNMCASVVFISICANL